MASSVCSGPVISDHSCHQWKTIPTEFNTTNQCFCVAGFSVDQFKFDLCEPANCVSENFLTDRTVYRHVSDSCHTISRQHLRCADSFGNVRKFRKQNRWDFDLFENENTVTNYTGGRGCRDRVPDSNSACGGSAPAQQQRRQPPQQQHYTQGRRFHQSHQQRQQRRRQQRKPHPCFW